VGLLLLVLAGAEGNKAFTLRGRCAKPRRRGWGCRSGALLRLSAVSDSRGVAWRVMTEAACAARGGDPLPGGGMMQNRVHIGRLPCGSARAGANPRCLRAARRCSRSWIRPHVAGLDRCAGSIDLSTLPELLAYVSKALGQVEAYPECRGLYDMFFREKNQAPPKRGHGCW